MVINLSYLTTYYDTKPSSARYKKLAEMFLNLKNLYLFQQNIRGAKINQSCTLGAR